jgi:hypothetical protein
MVVSLYGAHIRAVPGYQVRHFEVTVGRVETEQRPARNFAVAPNVQATKPGMIGNALRAQGWLPGRDVVVLSDGDPALVDYGRRYRAGLRIATYSAESAVNSLVNARMNKRRQMRWSPHCAHRVLQVRAAVIDGRPLDTPRGSTFIATPQRGGFVADGSLAQLIGQLVTLPLSSPGWPRHRPVPAR